MALETLRNVGFINNQLIVEVQSGMITDGQYVVVDHEKNTILFKIQNGPIKEAGKNGCQVEDVIAVSKHIVEQLNSKFPCRENAMMITKLDEAIMWSKKRTANRKTRGVEGTSNN